MIYDATGMHITGAKLFATGQFINFDILPPQLIHWTYRVATAVTKLNLRAFQWLFKRVIIKIQDLYSI